MFINECEGDNYGQLFWLFMENRKRNQRKRRAHAHVHA
jgi:hypothetical protein